MNNVVKIALIILLPVSMYYPYKNLIEFLQHGYIETGMYENFAIAFIPFIILFFILAYIYSKHNRAAGIIQAVLSIINIAYIIHIGERILHSAFLIHVFTMLMAIFLLIKSGLGRRES
jgi:hypothetical protein